MKAQLVAFIAWVAGWLAHDSHPPATTFAEGQQAIMVKRLALAGIGATAIVLGIVAVLVLGVWADANERLILYIIAGVAGLYGLTNLAIVLSFAVGGPVGRIDLEATRNGIKAGVSDKESDQ